MPEDKNNPTVGRAKTAVFISAALFAVGMIVFLIGTFSDHPERAWQAYLVNFLLWSGIAQGAVLFSAVMHITKARWTGTLSGLSMAFAGFFPLSFILFLVLFVGKNYVFPWLHEDLHGKEIWLNLPFLFTRDAIGLLILYGIGFNYLYYALQLKFDPQQPSSGIRTVVYNGWKRNIQNQQFIRSRMTVWAGLYILAFALVLSLIGFDLVMAADPHWISTLFGGYTFVKAFYTGLGALIILAALFRLRDGDASGLTSTQFHDIGKLFFAFCLLWADFFYVQLVVIWYGNIPEETHYVIARTMMQPWKNLAWTVFALSFILPFIILINKKVKTIPVAMIILCGLSIIGIWLEHLLLLGPALSHNTTSLPIGLTEILIFAGFLGLMVIAVGRFIQAFPETGTSPHKRQAITSG